MYSFLFKKKIIENNNFNEIVMSLNELFSSKDDEKVKILTEDFVLIKSQHRYILKSISVNKYLVLPNIFIDHNQDTKKIELTTTLNLLYFFFFIIVIICMGIMVILAYQLPENDGASLILKIIISLVALGIIYRNIKYYKETLDLAHVILKRVKCY